MWLRIIPLWIKGTRRDLETRKQVIWTFPNQIYSTEWMTGTTTAILLPQLDGRFNSEKVLTLVFTLFCSARVFWSIMDKIYLPFKFNILLNLMQFLKLFFVFHLGMLKHTHVYFTSMEMFVHFCTPSKFLKYHIKFLTRDATTISIRFPFCC